MLAAIGDMPANTTPVVRTEPDLGSGTYALPPTALAIDPATYATGGWWRSDFSATPIDQILDALASEPTGYPLPTGASTLEISLDVPGKAAGIGVTATVIDDDGVTHTPEPQPVSIGSGTYRISLEPGTRLLSITLHAETLLDLPFRFPVAISQVDVDGAPLSLDGWVPLDVARERREARAHGRRIPLRRETGAGSVFAGLIPQPAPMPALVSTNVAGQVDDTFDVTPGQPADRAPPVRRRHPVPEHVPERAVRGRADARAPRTRARGARSPASRSTRCGPTGRTDPQPALRERGFVPGRVVQASGADRRALAQLPQSLAVGMNFTAARPASGS